MAAYTCWQDVLDHITRYCKKTKRVMAFSALKTNEDRISFCLSDDAIRKLLLHWLNVTASLQHRKSWQKASEHRIEGNKCFQKKNYKKAVECYNKSILAAPLPKSSEAQNHAEELALAFANRSAAFFHLQNPQACLVDICSAFQYGYPPKFHYKLYQRKAQALLQLGKTDEASRACDQALNSLQDADFDSQKHMKLQEEILELKTLSSRSVKQLCDTPGCKEAVLPALLHGSNPALPCASAAVDMKNNLHQGRHVVANRTITAGDTLFVEKPYASVLLPSHYGTYCHHCYGHIVTIFPCCHCTQVQYCSWNCCKESWERYHKWECGQLDVLHSVGIAHLSCRVILETGLQQLEDFQQRLYDRGKSPAADSVHGFDATGCYGNSYCSVFYLMTNSQHMHVIDKVQYSLTAALILLMLDKVGYFKDSTDSWKHSTERVSADQPVDLGQVEHPLRERNQKTIGTQTERPRCHHTLRLFIGGLILRHAQQLVCNAHAITTLQEVESSHSSNNIVEQEQVRIATAIYPTASLMNHSCDPTIISSFCKDVLIVRSVKDVPEGGEIFNCYGPHFRRMSREERKKALAEQYFFDCHCVPCTQGEEQEWRFQALKCAHCEGPLRFPDGGGKATCLDCSKEQECEAQQQRAFLARDLYIQGMQLSEKGSYREALDKLRKCLRIREKVLYCHNSQLSEVRDRIGCCYAALHEYFLAVDYMRPAIDTVEIIYGANSIEMANELQKYTDILMNALPQFLSQQTTQEISTEISDLITETKQAIQRAIKIFSMHYGPDNIAIKELKEKEVHLQEVGWVSKTSSQTPH